MEKVFKIYILNIVKKIFIILVSLLVVITFNSNVYADKLLESGFLNNKMDYSKNQNIDDPKNKTVLIYNHA